MPRPRLLSLVVFGDGTFMWWSFILPVAEGGVSKISRFSYKYRTYVRHCAHKTSYISGGGGPVAFATSSPPTSPLPPSLLPGLMSDVDQTSQ
ncbi:hypothetical protein T492DRAFT_949719 [Pavlovales sp. CCMP2436]|nr:hypothetical protein T492DRAFT_949719 [Pavlovales sp. CCMP2436]